MSKKSVKIVVKIDVKPRHGVHFTKHQASKRVKNKARNIAKKIVKEFFNE